MTRNDSSHDDDDHDDDGGGDDDDAGDDDGDDRAGDDDDAVLSCDTFIVILVHNRWAKCPPPSLEKPYLLPTPKSCFSHHEAIPGWKPTASSTVQVLV